MWYTSGIESFISTMETSSLMGMNVARLIADGWKREVYEGEMEKLEMEGKKVSAKEGLQRAEDGNRGAVGQVPLKGKATAEEL